MFRIVARCIVGPIVGCYDDLAERALCIPGSLLSPLSLGKLVIWLSGLWWGQDGKSAPPPSTLLSFLSFVMTIHLFSLLPVITVPHKRQSTTAQSHSQRLEFSSIFSPRQQ